MVHKIHDLNHEVVHADIIKKYAKRVEEIIEHMPSGTHADHEMLQVFVLKYIEDILEWRITPENAEKKLDLHQKLKNIPEFEALLAEVHSQARDTRAEVVAFKKRRH